MFLPSRAIGVVYSNLELMQTQHQYMLPSHIIVLTLSNYRMSELKNASFSGLNLLKGLLWSILPSEAMMVSVVHFAAPGQVET